MIFLRKFCSCFILAGFGRHDGDQIMVQITVRVSIRTRMAAGILETILISIFH